MNIVGVGYLKQGHLVYIGLWGTHTDYETLFLLAFCLNVAVAKIKGRQVDVEMGN